MKNRTFLARKTLRKCFIYISISRNWSYIYTNSLKRVNNINREYKHYLISIYDK
jgi:hypothetical protein